MEIKEKEIMTPEELSNYLDISTDTLSRMEKQGLKPCTWSGKRKFYLFEDVIKFMKGLQA